MTVLRLRRSRWRTQGRILALTATVWFLASWGFLGGPGRAGAASLEAKSPPAGLLLAWSTLSTGTAHPPALTQASAVYDPDTGSVVLFGGMEADGNLSDDTWVWNGASWTDFPGSKTKAPPARQMASMAYDPAQHQLILFGGLGAGNQILGDTWAWNGASWYEEEPASTPPPREAAALAFDGSNLVLFGGTGDAASGPAADPTAPPGSPVAASSTATSTPAPATSAPPSATSTTTSATPVVLDDTWLWTGTGWQQATVTGPSARSGAAMSYDPTKHDTVLFGGEATPAGSSSPSLLGDTWTWDGSAWKHAAPHTSPSPREGASMADDTDASGVVLTAGSLGAGGSAGDTWLWNGTNWAQPRLSGAPQPRAGAAAAYDSDSHQLVLFGGESPSAGVLDDTVVLTAPRSSSAAAGSSPGSTAGASGPTSPSTPSIRPGGTAGSSEGAGGRSTPPAHREAAPLSATATVVHRNQSVTLSGSGFAARTSIEITFHSTPVVVGHTTTDGFGYFSTTVLVPATATGGAHHFEATGEGRTGGTAQLLAAVKVVIGGPPRASTNQTLIMVGVALLVPLAVWLFLSGSDRIQSRSRRNQRDQPAAPAQ
jgi:hypothetical protein